MHTTRRPRRVALAAVAAGALIVAACGGGADDSGTDTTTGAPVSADADSTVTEPMADPETAVAETGVPADDAPVEPDASSAASPPATAAPQADVSNPTDDPAEDVGSQNEAPADTPAEPEAPATSTRYDDVGVDLVGVEVGAASNIESNPFPDVVVDDLNRDKQVNLRNIIPGQRPLLLWFWAPH